MKLLHKIILFAALTVSTAAFSQATFRAPRMPAIDAVSLPAPIEKAALEEVTPPGVLRVGSVRDLGKAARILTWTPVAGGYVARFTLSSATAVGLRARLDLGAMPGEMELRVQGSDARVESMVLDPSLGPEAWTPWTEGATQLVELFSRVAPSDSAVSVGALLHMTKGPFEKADAASCTISTACSSEDAVLDAQIDERKKSVMKLQYVKGTGGFQCTGTLIDTPRRPIPYVLTANHCIETPTVAATATSIWFYESTSCGDNTPSPNRVQVSGGMQLVFTSFNADSTLLQMNVTPPAGSIFSPINPALVNPGTNVVSISHPRGDTQRWATGSTGAILRDAERPYDMYSVNLTRGIIEGGSSGSGLFAAQGGRLVLQGILSQGAINLSCEQPSLFTLYGRLEAFYPMISQYIGVTGTLPDDAPNRPQDVTAAISTVPVDTGGEQAFPNRRIDYAGDVDVFKFTIAARSAVSAYTLGTMDTVGTLLDSNGVALQAEDDAQRGDTNTGITRVLGPGTYYFSVGNWVPTGTGTYEFRLRADHVDQNYTALWWNADESGWGVNVDHQGNILFATLFNYDTDGSPTWLVMSGGALQADGSYFGKLYSTTGPPFNAVPWGAYVLNEVGTMRFAFSSSGAGALTYTYKGSTITKSITRLAFKTLPECTWSAFDRSRATNYQDLWWNPAEPGWGVNIAHQGDTLFATIFTYAANGRPLWFVMSDGARIPGTQTYTGDLFTTTGPPFNATPWTGPIVYNKVGTLSFTFANGNSATMSYTVNGAAVNKQVSRLLFGVPATICD